MFIFSNLATSIDGKIATVDRSYFPLGSQEDRDYMQVLRKKSDAILMGASSLRTYKKFCGLRGSARFQPANVILSSKLEGISPTWPFFEDSSKKRILLVTGEVAPKRLKLFEKSCTIVQLKKSPDLAKKIIKELSKLGIKRLLIEGGGQVMWDFARHNLINEYHVTLTPRILGGENAPTLVDGAGFSPKESLQLKLIAVSRLGSELFLRYKRQ